MAQKKNKRFSRLIPEGGVECFQIRVALFFDEDGKKQTVAEVTVPGGSSDELEVEHYDCLALLEAAKDRVRELYEDE